MRFRISALIASFGATSSWLNLLPGSTAHWAALVELVGAWRENVSAPRTAATALDLPLLPPNVK